MALALSYLLSRALTGSQPVKPPQHGFGHGCRCLFALDPEYINFNHGSFGTTPKVVLDAQSRYRALAEARPDPWFRATYRKLWNKSRDAIAGFIRADPADVVLLENATTAVNSVVRSISWHEGDSIITFDFAYPMVKNTLAWLQSTSSVNIIIVPTPPRITCPEDIESALQATLLKSKDANIRLAIFDHIVSVPHIILPIAKLTYVSYCCRT